jgi:phosphate/sulfate permease
MEEKLYIKQAVSRTNMILQALAPWGCIPEITRGCIDMTNASSTYLSIALGAIVGGLIAWWVYKIQKKTTVKQDETLRRIDDLEESHDKVLKSIQHFQQHQERLLNKILSLEDKINAIVEANKHD